MTDLPSRGTDYLDEDDSMNNLWRSLYSQRPPFLSPTQPYTKENPFGDIFNMPLPGTVPQDNNHSNTASSQASSISGTIHLCGRTALANQYSPMLHVRPVQQPQEYHILK